MRISILLVWLFLESCGRTVTTKSDSYEAGFQTLHITDKSRNYKSGTDTTNPLYFRPIDVDVWYPADSSANDTALLVHDLLGLLEQRANYYTASNAGNGIAAQLAQFFCDGFKCSDSARLLRFATGSYTNATATSGKFPLVIYMTAFNGMSYENFTLFETLAKKGFVVASISSIGRFPGDMTMKREDLMEQVNDAIAAVHTLQQNPNIDFTHVGIVGYSWGGLAGALLAGKLPDARCLVSLEGSEFHHYGDAKDENADFDTIKTSSDFAQLHLSMPYLRLESAPSTQAEKVDSVYNFVTNHTTHQQIFTIDSAQHEDFDCFSLVVRESGDCVINQRYKTALQLTVDFLDDNLKNKNNFSNTAERKMNKTMHRK